MYSGQLTIGNFIYWHIDPSFLEIEVYDVNLGENVWEGFADELPEEFEDQLIDTYEVSNSGVVTFNI